MSALDMLNLVGSAKPSAMRLHAMQRFAPANGASGQSSFADFLQQQISLGTGAQSVTAVDAATAGAKGQGALAASLQTQSSQPHSSQAPTHRQGRNSLLDLQDLGSAINAVPPDAPTFGDQAANTIG